MGNNTDPVLILRFLGISPSSSNVLQLLLSVCQQIEANYPEKVDADEMDKSNDDFNHLITRFRDLLVRPTQQKPLLILLDSLDQLSPGYFAYKLNWIPRELPDNVYVLLSTLPEEHGILDTCKQRVDFVNLAEVPLMDDNLCLDILQSWMKESNRTLTNQQYNIANNAFKICGLPLYVKLVFEQVLQWKSYSEPSTCKLVYTIKAMINSLLESIESRHGKLLVTRSLAYITASRNGLSETELEDVLSLDDEVLTDVFQYHVPPIRRIPPLLWVRIHHDIRHYIVTRLADDTTVTFWYHRQFIETAKERYLQNREDALQIHTTLSDYYEGRWYNREKPFKYSNYQMKKLNLANPESKADRKVAQQAIKTELHNKVFKYNIRKLNQWPFHLYHANKIEELKLNCLFNYNWLYSKMQASSIAHLIADYDLIPKDSECIIVKSALSFITSSLIYYPSSLAYELIGRLLPYTLNGNTRYNHIGQLIDQCYSRGIHHCALMPTHQCFFSPGGALKYAVEHPRFPFKSSLFCISETSNTAFILTNANELVQWDMIYGQMEKETLLFPVDSIKLNVMSKSHDGKYALVGGAFQNTSNPVIVIGLSSGDVINTVELDTLIPKIGFTDDVNIDMTRTQDRIIMTARGKLCHCFDTETGRLLHTFQVRSNNAYLTMNDEFVIFPINKTNTVQLYDMDGYALIKTLTFEQTPMMILTGQNSTPTVFVLFTENSNMCVLDIDFRRKSVAQESKLISLTSLRNKVVRSASLSKDESIILISYPDQIAVISVKQKYKVLYSFTIPSQIIDLIKTRVFNMQCTVDNPGTKVVAVYHSYLFAWSLRSGQLIGSLEVSKSLISNFALTSDGQHALISSKNTNILQIGDLSRINETYHSPLTLNTSVRYIDRPMESDLIVMRTNDPLETLVLNSKSGEIVSKPSPQFEVMRPYISPNGKYLVLMEYDSNDSIKIWNTESGRHTSTIPVSTLRLKEYVISLNSKMVLTQCEDSPTQGVDISIWDVVSGSHLKKLNADTGGFSWIYFANNDKSIVGLQKCGQDGQWQVQAFNVTTGEPTFTLERMKQESVHMFPDGSKFVAVQFQPLESPTDQLKENLKLWDATSGQELIKYNMSIDRRGHISADCKRFAYKGHVIDLEDGRTLCDFEITKVKLVIPRLTSDGRHLVWGDFTSNTVHVGRVDDQAIVAVCPIHSAIMSFVVSIS